MAEHGAARYVASFKTYRQFLGKEYDPGLTVNFIAGIEDHLRVKLVRKSPQTFSEGTCPPKSDRGEPSKMPNDLHFWERCPERGNGA